MSVYGKFRRALRSELIAELGVRPGSDRAVRRDDPKPNRANAERATAAVERPNEPNRRNPNFRSVRTPIPPRSRTPGPSQQPPRAGTGRRQQTSQTRVSRRRARLLFETAVSCLLYARVRVRKRVARFADRACRYTITSQRPCSAVRGTPEATIRVYGRRHAPSSLVTKVVV